MAILFDHICEPCKHKFEGWVENGQACKCPKCGKQAFKVPGGNIDWNRMGLDAESFPTCGDKWAKAREQRARQLNPDRDASGW